MRDPITGVANRVVASGSRTRVTEAGPTSSGLPLAVWFWFWFWLTGVTVKPSLSLDDGLIPRTGVTSNDRGWPKQRPEGRVQIILDPRVGRFSRVLHRFSRLFCSDSRDVSQILEGFAFHGMYGNGDGHVPRRLRLMTAHSCDLHSWFA